MICLLKKMDCYTIICIAVHLFSRDEAETCRQVS